MGKAFPEGLAKKEHGYRLQIFPLFQWRFCFINGFWCKNRKFSDIAF